MTLLEDLWYGNIDPHEAILTGSKRYKHLLSLMARNRDELNETLTEKQSERLKSTMRQSMKCTHWRKSKLFPTVSGLEFD